MRITEIITEADKPTRANLERRQWLQRLRQGLGPNLVRLKHSTYSWGERGRTWLYFQPTDGTHAGWTIYMEVHQAAEKVSIGIYIPRPKWGRWTEQMQASFDQFRSEWRGAAPDQKIGMIEKAAGVSGNLGLGKSAPSGHGSGRYTLASGWLIKQGGLLDNLHKLVGSYGDMDDDAITAELKKNFGI